MGESPRILIVDDEEHLLLLLRDNLSFDGFHVIEARDGFEALDRAIDSRPDLIVLDIGLPRLDGWAVCQRLQSDATTRTIPIVFLSARAQDEDIRRGRECGAVAYFTKPCNPGELVKAIKNILAARTSPPGGHT